MANSLLIFFFFVIINPNSPLIQARESKFFSKFTHFTTLTNSHLDTPTISSPIESPSSSPILSPPPALSKGDDAEALFDSPTNGDESELFDAGETYRKVPQSVNGDKYSNEHGSESHETANRNSNYNYNTNNGYQLVSTSSSHENGYEPVSTSSSRETAANDEKNYNGYNPNFSYNTNSFGDGNQLSGDEAENERKNQRQGMSDTRYVESRNEPVSTSSSRETSGDDEKNYDGYTPYYGYKTDINGDGNEVFRGKTGIEQRNERQGMSDTRFVENGKYHYDLQRENENNNYPANRYYDHNKQINYNGNSVNEFDAVDFENQQEVYEP